MNDGGARRARARAGTSRRGVDKRDEVVTLANANDGRERERERERELPPSFADAIGRCVIDDVMEASTRLTKTRAVDFITFDSANAHGRAFEASAWRSRLVNDRAFESLSKKNHLKKEITEAYGALAAVRRAIEGRRTRTNAKAEDDGGDLILFDLCSGRGFVSIVLASEFPNARVFMIDNDTTMNVEHVESFGERLTFHALDAFHDETETFIREIARAGPTKTVVIVGVHLCGTLAHRAIELYERIHEVSSLVVSPCCLPRRRRTDAFGYFCIDVARSVHASPYTVWCTQLFLRIPRSHRRNMIIDHDMLCAQNTVIVATKPSYPRHDDDIPQPFIVPGRRSASWIALRHH